MNNEQQNEQNEQPQVEQAISTTGTTAVAETPKVGNAFIQQMLIANQQAFMEANEGLDLDFVRMGDWLKMNKLGNFVEAADDTVNYGSNLDVVVGMGEQRYMLWGADGSPEKGQLIVAEKAREEAEAALNAWLYENPNAASRYTQEDIDLRYLAYVVPVDVLRIAAEEGVPPKVYLMDFPKGDTIGWGKFTKAVFDGKYKPLGVPAYTGASRVVIRISAEERKNPDNETYLGRKFDCIGLFKPEDYGVVQA